MNYAENIAKKAKVNENAFDAEYAGKVGTIVEVDDADDPFIFYKLTFDDKLLLLDEWFSQDEITILDEVN